MPKLTELTEQTTLTNDDIFVFVNDPDGTPATYKITTGDLRTQILSLFRLPNYTTAEMNALTPALGMMVYNTTASAIYIYQNDAWELLSAGGSSGGATDLDGLTDVVIDGPGQYHVLAYDDAEQIWVNRVLQIADITGLQTALDGKQPIDADLTTIAGLTATTNNVIQSVLGQWASRTPTQLKSTLNLGKADVGLGNADNTSDADKPISTATQSALNAKADLDGDGYVPASQLPSYVDDVLEYADLASFPATGASGKIYLAIDTKIIYRWSGSGYVEISSSLALGETSSTAYRGDRGKTAYDHSQLTTGNPHNVTATDLSLGNVDNTADLDKPISTATQTALDAKADDSDLTSHTGNTSNPHSVTATQVGLGNVDNTADADKPISDATQTALDAKAESSALDSLSIFPIATKHTGVVPIHELAGSINGTVDVYTCPSGKRAYITAVVVYNSSGSTRTFLPKTKIGGTYYRNKFGAALNVSNGNGRYDYISIILEAGESFSLISDGTGMDIQVMGYEYNDTDPLKTVKFVSFSSGNNTIYTVPTGKIAKILAATNLPLIVGPASTIVAADTNSPSLLSYHVPSGGSPGNDNIIRVNGALLLTAPASSSLSVPEYMFAGDSLVVNTDTAGSGQIIYFNYFEIDA